MPKGKYKDKLLEVSGGVIYYLADLLVFMITYGVELCSASYSSKGAGEAYARAVQQLAGIEEKKTIYGLKELKKGGFVKYKRGMSDIEITKAGRKRLRRFVPVYEKRRRWDGRLYLITYDIPESKRQIRDYFRDHLKALGCGMLQASVWITPYDPREVLRKFIQYNRLEGEVLISYAGKDSNVAGTDFKELVRRVYRLDELNKRYKEFLKSPLDKWPRYRVAVAYYSILKDDPQLPFELLPKGWKGNEAYEKFSRVKTQRPLG